MATPLTTLKNWFKTGLKPTQAQFWAVFDSFRHKDDAVPAADVSGLQLLLDGKMDKKAITATIKAGTYVPGQAYVYDALVPEYVSFSNPASPNPDFVAEGWYRLTANATGAQTPETNPEIWKYNGRTLGDVTIEDVFGLREELDALAEGTGTGGGHVIQNDAGEALAQQAALQFKGVSVNNEVGKTVVDMTTISKKYHAQFSFVGHTNFTIRYLRPVIISAFSKASSISDLRIGKNGASPITLTVPYLIAVNDVIEFAATYPQDVNSDFTLIGTYND